jgi:ABC-type lipoprotein release transport system permease subunit
LAPLQEVLALQDQAHELVVQLHDPERLEEGRTGIQAGTAGADLLVRTWQEANPTAAKLLGSQNVGKGIMLGIVFSVAALGVLNTMLMSVFERTRELGVLRAIGMTPLRVLGLVLAEATLLGGLSSAAGLLLGGLFDLFLVYRGIDMSLDGKGMSYAGIRFDPIIRGEVHADGILMTIGFVFFVSIVAAIWPAVRAARLRPVDAMRQV